MFSGDIEKNSNKGFEMYSEPDPVIAKTIKMIKIGF
jgi:hypothetical protein